MGRLVWFGVVALSPMGAAAAVTSLVLAGAATGYAVASRRKPRRKKRG